MPHQRLNQQPIPTIPDPEPNELTWLIDEVVRIDEILVFRDYKTILLISDFADFLVARENLVRQ